MQYFTCCGICCKIMIIMFCTWIMKIFRNLGESVFPSVLKTWVGTFSENTSQELCLWAFLTNLKYTQSWALLLCFFICVNFKTLYFLYMFWITAGKNRGNGTKPLLLCMKQMIVISSWVPYSFIHVNIFIWFIAEKPYHLAFKNVVTPSSLPSRIPWLIQFI